MHGPPIKEGMEYRYLGPTGIKVSVISYGNWVNSNSQEAADNTIKCVKAAWDLGINFFDTAQVYGFGEAEKQIGQALRLLAVPRHQYVLSTKIYWGFKENIPNRRGLSRKHIIEGMKSSLKRLGSEYVDIVFCHRPDPNTPMEEICRAMDWVIRKGWAFYWGTSEWNEYDIAEAHMVCDKYHLVKPVAQQPEYNLFNREKVEVKYKNLLSKKLLGTTIWSPLLSGILTGKYNKGMPEGNRFQKNPDLIGIYNRYFTDKKEQTLIKLNQFEDLAKKLGCSMAQLALAWCINNPDVSTAITGASNPEQLKETVKAIQVRKLITPAVEAQIEGIFQTTPLGKRSMATLKPEESRRKDLLPHQ